MQAGGDVYLSPAALAGPPFFNVKAYGAKGDGTTDDTAAIQAAITALQSAGGGMLWFPQGHYLIDGELSIAYSGPSTAPVQVPMRWTGTTGPNWNGYWASDPLNSGSIIDLRYNGGGTNVAKIDTRGAGFFEIDHLTILSGGTDDYQILQTTNTTLRVHDCCIVGNQNNSGTACAQDFAKLGGGNGAVGDGSTARFQGYGTRFYDNFYSNIQRGIIFQTSANGVQVDNETYSQTCGSSLAQGAPYWLDGLSGGLCVANRIRSCTVEITNYAYGVTFNENCQYNLIDSCGFYDASGATTVGGVYCGTTSVEYNLIIIGFLAGGFSYVYGPSSSSQTILTGFPTGGATGTTTAFPGGLVASQVVQSATGGAQGGFYDSGAADILVIGAAGNGSIHMRPLGSSSNNGKTVFPGSGGQGIIFYDGGGTARASISSGTGAPTIGGLAGDLYIRTDTPSTANQRIYVCTVAGTAGAATWVGIV